MTWSTEEASVQVDTYLDELLVSRSRYLRAGDDASAELVHAAAAVRDALVRFHPSFRFEEELAARLRAIATGAAQVARAAGSVVPFPAPAALSLASAGEPSAAQPGTAEPSAVERGWMLVGGAIASGVSLAAGLLLARRRSRHAGHWERLV